jgi:TetR/AcrR family transcriptional regulator, transcriptional repressor for nem operon
VVRYPRGHKERTREQIVEAAARAFREEGIDGVGIGELMGRAGLTHGGFYAHFPSKDALAAEVCSRAMDQSGTVMGQAVAHAPPGAKLAGFIRAYISRRHRDDPGAGCVMPTLGSEMPRHAPEVRGAFTAQIRRVIDGLQPLMPAAPGDAATEDRAIALAAGMAGAVLLARAVDDPALSDRILEACRGFWIDAFPEPDA